MQNVIFLDIDGVLNSWAIPVSSSPRFEERHIRCLQELLSRIESPQIVISSHWRKIYNLAELSGFLGRAGIAPGVITDITPQLDGCDRGEEILRWLALNDGQWNNYVALDDRTDLWQLGPSFVWINGGLRSSHVEQAVKILSEREA